jgi:hypothetical protein
MRYVHPGHRLVKGNGELTSADAADDSQRACRARRFGSDHPATGGNGRERAFPLT